MGQGGADGAPCAPRPDRSGSRRPGAPRGHRRRCRSVARGEGSGAVRGGRSVRSGQGRPDAARADRCGRAALRVAARVRRRHDRHGRPARHALLRREPGLRPPHRENRCAGRRISSPAQRGRGTMRSMVEGAQGEGIAGAGRAPRPLHRLRRSPSPAFAGEEFRGTVAFSDRPLEALPGLLHLGAAEAAVEMVVDDADALHEGVHRRRADEGPAALLQFLR